MNYNATVLVVDDNKNNLELFMESLALGGYKGLQASSGEEALEIVQLEHPDLVLLDIQLPGINGLTVAKILKNGEATKHIKVVALTAYSLQMDNELFTDKAFDGYLSKPVSLKDFLSALDSYFM